MEYSFDLGSFFIGLIICLVGGALVIFHRQVADNFVGGVNSYEKIKLVGIIGVVLGLFIATGIMNLILGFIFQSIFGGVSR
jgi:hypothetical protein